MTSTKQPSIDTITVAVLTYRRNEDLRELLPMLDRQLNQVEGRVVGGILVIDNDQHAGARIAVDGLDIDRLTYVHEATPGIAAARNRALDESVDSRLLVFIDDDERPADVWLASLLDVYDKKANPAAVVGSVKSRFVSPPEPWVAAGDFFRRRQLPTGTPVQVAATNNLLLDLDQVRRLDLRFDLQTGTTGGEDTLFTRQLARAGGRLIWCDEAVVTDIVPPGRVSRSWVLRRALSSGNSASLTEIRLTAGRCRRLLIRLRCGTLGAIRVLGGGARAAFGYLTRSRRHQAKGARTAARGLGMIGGICRWSYEEYRR